MDAFGTLPVVLVVFATIAFATIVLAGRGKTSDRGKRSQASPAVAENAQLDAKPLLNKSERVVFTALSALTDAAPRNHRVMVQVSVGEVLTVRRAGISKGDWWAQFNSLNSKRFDFLIADEDWNAVAAVEYQGRGHSRGNAEKRDNIKREACRKAGIPFIEIPADGLTPGQTADLKRLLGGPQALAAE